MSHQLFSGRQLIARKKTRKNNFTISSIQLTGDTTFIKLTDVVGGKSKEDDIAVGDWLVIGDNAEKVKVLEIDTTLNRYRVLRQSGITTFHAAGQRLSIDQRRFTFSVGINTNLNIIRNKLVCFQSTK